MISVLCYISSMHPREQVEATTEITTHVLLHQLNIFPLILTPAAVRCRGLLHMAYIMRQIQAVQVPLLNAE